MFNNKSLNNIQNDNDNLYIKRKSSFTEGPKVIKKQKLNNDTRNKSSFNQKQNLNDNKNKS